MPRSVPSPVMVPGERLGDSTQAQQTPVRPEEGVPTTPTGELAAWVRDAPAPVKVHSSWRGNREGWMPRSDHLCASVASERPGDSTRARQAMAHPEKRTPTPAQRLASRVRVAQCSGKVHTCWRGDRDGLVPRSVPLSADAPGEGSGGSTFRSQQATAHPEVEVPTTPVDRLAAQVRDAPCVGDDESLLWKRRRLATSP